MTSRFLRASSRAPRRKSGPLRGHSLRSDIEQLEDRSLPALLLALGFEAGAGVTATDTSGNALHGTLANATWTASGKYGNALSFNGTNALVSVPDNALLHLTNGMTLEAWVRPAAASANWSTAVLKERGTNSLDYALYANDGANKPPAGYVNINGADRAAAGSGVLPVNTWTFLAATYDGATIRTYVNGTQVGTRAQTGTISASTAPLRIGGNAVWGEWFNGLIDEVRVYNNALTAAQIQADMNTPVISGPDTVAPSVAVTSPGEGATVAGSVAVSANASDNVGVAGVQFYMDGNPLGTEDTTAPFAITWNSLAAADGPHAIAAVARDAAGNKATSVSVAVTVSNSDTTSPTVSIAAPANNATVTGGSVTVSASASDNVEVVGVQFQLDGVNLGTEDTTAPYSISWDSTSAVGSRQITAIARDAAGNKTTSTAVAVAVTDSTSPTVTLTAPSNNSTVSGATVTVSGTSSDNVAVVGVQFKLDGVALGAEDTVAPYAIVWDSRTAPNGTHTLAAVSRDAAGNTTTSSVRTITVSNTVTDPAIVGQWSAVMDWPLVAINAVLLNTGKVLMWDGGPDCIGAVSATVWDPATNTFSPAPSETAQHVRDIFCSAQTVLPDGRVLVAGGHECDDPSFTGTAISEIFDPATQTWTNGPDMAYRRWYPTLIALPNGKALVVAGSVRNTLDYVPIPEVYDPVANTWTQLTGASKTIPNYNFSFVLPDGRVLVAGSDEAKMATYALDVANQTWTTIDSTVLDGGSAVMYAPGKIMKSGSSYLSAPLNNGGNTPSTATTYVLDMTQSSPAWQQTASMAYARTHHNLTVLPDGSVLVTGGSSVIGGIDPATGVLPAELWNPVTKTWTTMAAEARAREYHSTALLLPDGRIMVAGSGHNYANSYADSSAEIFSPSYLFKGARPTITSSPDTIAYGSSFFVGTPDAAAIASVSLIRNGSVTHSFNMDQRLIPLTFQVADGGLTLTAPVDGNTAPPGTYMLFIVNSNGVPSVAPFVNLPAPYQDAEPPTSPNLSGTALSDTSIGLTWSPASDNLGVTGYDVHRSTTPGFTPSAANLIAQTASTSYTDNGLPGGTFYYRVAARDAAGNVGSPSNEAGASVAGDFTPPTVGITSPSSGSTVSGSVNVAANAADDVIVAGVQFFLDGNALGAEDTAAPYSLSWSTATTTNGAHTLTARARDAAGNTAVSNIVTVTVANTALPGLVAAYGFDEGSGSSVGDATANGLNGAISNAVWVAGKFGQALSFNGTNAAVTIADAAALHLTTALTMEAWVKPAAASNGFDTVVLKERGTSSLAYALYAADGSGKPPSGYVNIGGADRAAKATSNLPANAWSHLAATYDGTTIRMYVNGTQVGTRAQTGSISSSTAPLRVGGNSVWGEYFNGIIDEVRLYNRALSPVEILTDMNSPVGGSGSPQLAAERSVQTAGARALSEIELGPIVTEATRRWLATGLDPVQIAALNDAQFLIADLGPTGLLGLTSIGSPVVELDNDGAGRGWFVDSTPSDDAEFGLIVAPAEVRADGGSIAGKYDLLTVVMHELGHVLGFDDLDPVATPHDLLAVTLPAGTRRLTTPISTVAITLDVIPLHDMFAPPPTPTSTTPQDVHVASLDPTLRMAPIAMPLDAPRRGTRVDDQSVETTVDVRKRILEEWELLDEIRID